MKSMTGFGRHSETLKNKEILVEMKSVNHRYLECNVKTPRLYSYLEDKLKKLVQKEVSRGKVDVNLYIHFTESVVADISLNETLVSGYLGAFEVMREKFGVTGTPDLQTISALPDIFTLNKPEEDEEEVLKEVLPIAKEALRKFSEMREAEGQNLQKDLLNRVHTIEKYVTEIEKLAPETVTAYRERLFHKMKEVLSGSQVDENRILLEAGIFAEKVAVDEETVRLRSHLESFKEMCASKMATGRKMDFLIQEMNREVNTIGSKAQNSKVAEMVIDCKAEIEKIREQVQNIE